MSADAASGSGLKLTRTQWLICFIATIGFLFDIYELLMLPLIAKSALLDIAGIQPGTPEFFTWVGRLFFIPAIVGGIFGLMGGWLTDRFGRRRVLTSAKSSSNRAVSSASMAATCPLATPSWRSSSATLSVVRSCASVNLWKARARSSAARSKPFLVSA